MLEYSREFVELAMRLNYAAAAEKLHLSASALSRHIADLESELGFALFNRNPLTLTSAGVHYLEEISTIIDDLDHAIAKGREISAHSVDRLSIYMLPTRAKFGDVIYETAAQMRRDVPGLATEICVDDRFLTTEEALLQGKADLGIVFEGSIVDNPSIETTSFAFAPLVVWVHRGNPLASQSTVTVQDLAPCFHPKSTNRQSHTATDSVANFLEVRGVDPKFRCRNLEDRAAFFLTLKADEFLLEFAGDPDPLRINPDLVELPFDEPVNGVIFMAYKRDCANPLVRSFVALAQSLSTKYEIDRPVALSS